MKNALLLHGSGNNSKGNWLPWLKSELEQKGFKVWVPDLPGSNYPDIDKWTKFVLSNKDWSFNQYSVIIGHSAGATFILGLLQNLPKRVKISKAILVAGFVELADSVQENKIKLGLLKYPFDWEKIKASCKKFYFIHSDNDRYQCDMNQGEIMRKKLGGELVFIPGEDHFNLETSPKYREFPELLKYL